MDIPFSKWQGTGNDFIVVDDRAEQFPAHDLDLVRRLCDRHFGIGSDGLVLIRPATTADVDYHMEFFNPDGSRSFCGNGSRCAFGAWSGLTGGKSARFSAVDGMHTARWQDGGIAIGMRSVDAVVAVDAATDRIHTGSPHELVWVADPAQVDVLTEGARRRYATELAPGGTNVNFLAVMDGVLQVRTYERGVEAETLSCGTGVTAAALSAIARGQAASPVRVRTPGGELLVEAYARAGGFEEVRLIGPAEEVFTGRIPMAP